MRYNKRPYVMGNEKSSLCWVEVKSDLVTYTCTCILHGANILIKCTII